MQNELAHFLTVYMYHCNGLLLLLFLHLRYFSPKHETATLLKNSMGFRSWINSANCIVLCMFLDTFTPRRTCRFGHDLHSEHNSIVLREHKLETLSRQELRQLLLQNDNSLLPPVRANRLPLTADVDQWNVCVCRASSRHKRHKQRGGGVVSQLVVER